MSRMRKRPDESRVPSYITPQGYRRLEEEAAKLWNDERPVVALRVATAAAEGDRSENAEYIYSKKKLAQIDRRLRFLGNRMDALTIVSETPPEDGKVYFGSYVTIEDDEGEERTYRIVGPDESDADKGYISVASPMAKALVGKSEGDDFIVKRPAGDLEAEIVRVRSKPAT